MGIEKFKLTRSSYDELCKIIQAYGQCDEPKSLNDIVHLSGMGKTTISANNAFLATVGIIEGGNKKGPTELGRELAKVLEYNRPTDIKKVWQKVIKQNDFLNKMVVAVRVRKGMGASDLESHVAYSSGEAKGKQVMTGARAVVDIFKASGLVEERDDRIIPMEKAGVGEPEEPEEKGIAEGLQKKRFGLKKQKLYEGDLGEGPVSLNIQVRIDAKPSELDGLGEKLKALIDSLGESPNSKAREVNKSGG